MRSHPSCSDLHVVSSCPSTPSFTLLTQQNLPEHSSFVHSLSVSGLSSLCSSFLSALHAAAAYLCYNTAPHMIREAQRDAWVNQDHLLPCTVSFFVISTMDLNCLQVVYVEAVDVCCGAVRLRHGSASRSRPRLTCWPPMRGRCSSRQARCNPATFCTVNDCHSTLAVHFAYSRELRHMWPFFVFCLQVSKLTFHA